MARLLWPVIEDVRQVRLAALIASQCVPQRASTLSFDSGGAMNCTFWRSTYWSSVLPLIYTTPPAIKPARSAGRYASVEFRMLPHRGGSYPDAAPHMMSAQRPLIARRRHS